MGLFDFIFGNEKTERELRDLRNENTRLKEYGSSIYRIDSELATAEAIRKRHIEERLEQIRQIPDVPGVVMETMFMEEMFLLQDLNAKRMNPIHYKMAHNSEGVRFVSLTSSYSYRDGKRID